MNNKLAWDDLKLILAIVEAGTLSGAGRALGCSHATVFRRLGDVETRLGARLFERSRSGYEATPAGEEAADAARDMAASVADLERRIAGRDLRPSGTVRVTTTDTLLAGLLAPVFVEFQRSFPEIGLEIAVSNDVFSLSKREADIAIRPSDTPPDTLVGRKAGRIAQAIYAATDLATKLESGDGFACGWIGPDERMVYPALRRWFTGRNLDKKCQMRLDTILGIHAAVRAGAGLAVLPCYLAEGDAALRRIGAPLPELAVDLWILTHQDLRKAARIRAFMDFTFEEISARGDSLAGVA
ncbi:LysR family transcriptional regulator [Rhizobiales bacterium]|uniref:LysR family transcriptional regulator n=1 Tax=Hongsoonwoonella zoysiae TaxID=2821844 RepID=UPI001560FDA4|nr:LysR family transcriptional regulator [Hongsoonwoonella zoysiae]NRG17115.1 LysR family transcriptional regulator [Hongsoonwoonella zoysiae]